MNLTTAQFNRLMAQRGGPTLAVEIAPAKRRILIEGVYRSKLERDYARHLELRQLAGEIRRWRYEPRRFELARRTTLAVDFIVWRWDGIREAHEVKGWMRDDAAVKLKWFADKYRDFKTFLVTRQTVALGGGWDVRVVKVD